MSASVSETPHHGGRVRVVGALSYRCDVEQDSVGDRPADEGTTIDGVAVLGSLSPSRAGDFLTCPLLYRFRTIDRLPEPLSPVAVRGTLVHKVLELLFDDPAPHRTLERAHALLGPSWEALIDDEPEVEQLFVDDPRSREAWWESCHQSLARYFDLEDPRRLEPAERELYVEALLASGLLLRGYVDRLDVAADGRVRVVDYKTGRSPAEAFEAQALFQMKFYALVLWRLHGRVPAARRLIYLGNAETLTYEPDIDSLRATERKVEAVWAAIRRAEADGEWNPSPSGWCRSCAHQAMCPAYGGQPPPLPTPPGQQEPQCDASTVEASPDAVAPGRQGGPAR